MSAAVPNYSGYIASAAMAERLGYDPEYVRNMARSGRIPGVKIGGRWHFDPVEVYDTLVQTNSRPKVEAPADDDDGLEF